MKKKWTTKITFAALAVMFALSGFGCKSVPADVAERTKPITLEYWTVYDDVDTINALADAYRQDHPYITFKIRQFRADEFYQQFVEALADGTGPDIISVQNKSLGQYQSKLAVMPQSVEDTTVKVVQGQFSNQTVYNNQTITLPNATAIGKEYVQAVGQDVVRNNKVYGLPLSFDTLALYYNKDLLDRVGIAEPPKTWDEFVADVQKLTKFDKANNNKIIQAGAALGVGNNVPASEDILYVLFRQSGVPFVGSNGKAVFNNTGGTTIEQSGPFTVLDFYTDFANPTKDRYTWNAGIENALDNFTHGSVAFFFGYYYNYPLIKQRAPQLNFDVVAIPQLNTNSPVNAANYWVQTVPLKSPHQAQAWAFLNYIAHSNANKAYLQKSARPAAIRSYLASQLQAANAGATSTPAVLSPFAAQALVAESWYKGANYEAARQALYDMFDGWLAPPSDLTRINEWKQGVLNRAVDRFNQTF